MPAALSLVFRVEPKVHQRIMAQRRRHKNVAAMPAIAARRPAARDELLAPEGHAAIAAITGLYADSCFINKHFSVSSVLGDGLNCWHTQSRGESALLICGD